MSVKAGQAQIQQLAVADLVVADISLGNANVYYEVGVRHAAAERGCALIAADWAKPVFDLAQMRRLQYPLTDGTISRKAAAKARQTLRAGLDPLAGARSPVFEAVPGYPDDVDLTQLPSFDEVVEILSRFDAAVEAIRASSGPERADLTRELLASYGDKRVIRESVVLGLLRLVRDNLDWSDLMAYVERLPPRLREHPLVREQLYLAQGKRGDPASAVGALTELIKRLGATSERQGLLGGRYKELMNKSQDPGARARYLDLAIEAYEKGMVLDLNDYYPTSNLPRLYRLRGREGDEHKAVVAATITAAAAQRSMSLGQDDIWVRQTLLGAAFDAGDVGDATRLLLEIRTEGPARWQLESTLGDLEVSLSLQRDSAVKAELSGVLASLQQLTDGGMP
jgi:tetratricopeptide repeat protein